MKALRINRKRVRTLAKNAICVMTALSLLFLQTPVVYAAPQDDADAVAIAQSDAATMDEAKEQETSEAKDAEDAAQADDADTAKTADAAEAEAGEEAASESESADDEAASTDEGEAEGDAAADEEQGESKSAEAEADAGDKADEAAAAEDKAGTSESTKAEADDKDKADKAKRNTKDTFVYENDSVKVTAKLADPSVLPADVDFVVTQVTSSSKDYNYNAYMDALNKEAAAADSETPEVYSDDDTLLYDVAFMAQKLDDKGNAIKGERVEVQLESGKVDLKFEFKNDQLSEGMKAEDAEAFEVKHLPLKKDVRDSVDSTAEAKKIDAGDVVVEAPESASVDQDANSMNLELSSLSVVSVHLLGASETKTMKLFGLDTAWFYANKDTAWHDVIAKTIKDIDFDHAVMSYTENEEGDTALLARYAYTFSNGLVQYGPVVHNTNTGNEWTLIGFVPYNGADDLRLNDPRDTRMEEYYGFATPEDAKRYVQDNNGVLYGEKPTDSLLGRNNQVMTVWYQQITTAATNTNSEYEGIDNRPAVNYAPTTDGITSSVEVSKASGNTHSTVTFTVTIPEDMDADELNINSLDLGDYDNLVHEPGDTVDYIINIIDKSGKYIYKERSGAEGTVPYKSQVDDTVTTFEGYETEYTKDHDSLSAFARRGLNRPIEDMLLDIYPRWAGQLDYLIDVVGFEDLLGDALLEHGYGAKLDDEGNVIHKPNGEVVAEDAFVDEHGNTDNSAVVQTYLHKYYLDWFNKNYDPKEKYVSFGQLDKNQMGILYKSMNAAQVTETNEEVVKAMYWSWYEYLFPVSADGENFIGSYTWMQKPEGYGEDDGNSFDVELSKQWEDSAAEGESGITHQVRWYQYIDGEYAANNMQNTKFGTGVQFKLVRSGATAQIEFDKRFYGGSDEKFDFVLTATDKDGNARTEGEAQNYGTDQVDPIADNGQPFTVTANNSAFEDGNAKVTFPEFEYAQDGTYYYTVTENESEGVDTDKSRYLVTVTVAKGEADVTYELQYPNASGGYDVLKENDEQPIFYNNEIVQLDMESVAYGYIDTGLVSIYPRAKKVLNGSTDGMVGGEFRFVLLNTDGTPVTDADGNAVEGVNDAQGDVAFYDEESQQGLVFDTPGTYNYIIREIQGSIPGMNYDESSIALTVNVTESDGVMNAEAVYSGDDKTAAVFHNTSEPISVKVRKTSRSDGAGLEGCTYALWMKGETGDVMVAEAVSDSDGWIQFDDVNLRAGMLYYFKEVAAPSGHLVDPYRTAYFTVAYGDDGTPSLEKAETTAADGWHAASYDE